VKALNVVLHRALEERTLQTASQSGLPIYHFDEHQQVGNTFGERIANAFESLFLAGHSSVICIGNDAATLDHVKWDSVSRSLNDGDNVLGPDFRKGAYLIGLTRQHFNKEQFQNLRWQTKYLIDDLRKYCVTYEELQQVSDLNHWEELKLVSKSFDAIRKIVTAICGVLSFPRFHSKPITIDTCDAIELRGPPQFILI
jgi:hypothetical protein